MKFALPFFIAMFLLGLSNYSYAAPPSGCEKPGWFPEDYGLKDHTVFRYEGATYIASIYLPREEQFAYGRSQDLCNWEDLGPILTERTPGDWDETKIWAPFILEDNGIFYMYYTGVTRDITQSIMLAISANPADPNSWQEQGMIFQPWHEGAVWNAGAWADCRDPHVINVDGVYYLYYTGRDVTGGMVGVASAPAPAGPWTDLGAVFDPAPGFIFESSIAVPYQDFYYLVYHKNIPGQSQGVFSLISESPTGPFREPQPLFPGWAHEIWQDAEGDWRVSYLTDNTITIAPLSWNGMFQPPRPFIGAQVQTVFLPITVHGQ